MIIFKVKDIEDTINFIKNEENIKNCIIYNYSRTRKFQIKFVENTKVLIQALSYKIIIEMELSDIANLSTSMSQASALQNVGYSENPQNP